MARAHRSCHWTNSAGKSVCRRTARRTRAFCFSFAICWCRIWISMMMTAPDTLRLCFVTPRRRLENGKRVVIHGAPTAFGDLSTTVQSSLQRGEVCAEMELPPHKPKRILLRLRLPLPWRVVSVTSGGTSLDLVDRETLDISLLSGHVILKAKVHH